ncbi:MAG: hypothetical protein AAF495_21815 [Pseudomonadota bacterium]
MPKTPILAVIAVAILVVGFLIGVWSAPDIEPLEERIAVLESQLEEHGGVSAAAQAAAGEAKTAAEESKGALDTLTAKVDEVAAKAGDTSAIEDRFKDLESSLTTTVGNLEAHVHDQMEALKTEVSHVTESLSAFKDETAAMIESAAKSTPAPSSEGAAAAGATQTAAAPSVEETPPEPGVQRLGIGGSAWAVDGLVSVALSAIQGEDSARVYVNGKPLVLELDRAVRLRDVPRAAGDCTATLKGIHGRKADIAVDCQS